MMQIETCVKPSSIHGLGCFTIRNVSAGNLIWKFIDDEKPACNLTDYVDNARFINHAEEANTGLDAEGNTMALRDISAGEEITEDYYLTVPELAWELHASQIS